jgi:hypothetical protein
MQPLTISLSAWAGVAGAKVIAGSNIAAPMYAARRAVTAALAQFKINNTCLSLETPADLPIARRTVVSAATPVAGQPRRLFRHRRKAPGVREQGRCQPICPVLGQTLRRQPGFAGC